MRLRPSTLTSLREIMSALGVRSYDPAIRAAVRCWTGEHRLASELVAALVELRRRAYELEPALAAPEALPARLPDEDA